jgi:FixJ family two-component response regulator
VSAAKSTDPQGPVVHVVEDDASTREATARLLRSAGHDVATYGSAQDFLAAAAPAHGCLLLDLQLPGLNGLDLQNVLNARGEPMPIVFFSGQGRIPDSVQAMKSGAVDFLPKTVDGSVLLEAVARALQRGAAERAECDRLQGIRERYERLTAREKEVFAHLISGQLNKQVGYDLGIAERTIKAHRRSLLEKMEADSIAELTRMAADLQIEPLGKVR